MVRSMFPLITEIRGRSKILIVIGIQWQCHRQEFTKPPWQTMVDRSIFPQITETRGRPKIRVAVGKRWQCRRRANTKLLW